MRITTSVRRGATVQSAMLVVSQTVMRHSRWGEWRVASRQCCVSVMLAVCTGSHHVRHPTWTWSDSFLALIASHHFRAGPTVRRDRTPDGWTEVDQEVSAPSASADFGVALTLLMRVAGLGPDGIRRKLGERRHLVGRSALYDWRNGRHLPEDDGALLEVIRICLAAARDRGAAVAPAPEDEQGWRELLAQARQARDEQTARTGANSPQQAAPTGHGLIIGEWDPVALGVHRAIGGGALPGYVQRPHDDLLRAVLDPGVTASRIVVLRGGSSTGKTRAAYEAIRERLPDWRVDHVQTPAVLAARINGGLAPRTVVWLDELRHFANHDTAIFGELNDLLARTQSVVVIATLWPAHWGAYTHYAPPLPGQPDNLAVLNQVLERLPELSGPDTKVIPSRGGVIDVPDRFTLPELVRAVQERNRAVIAAIRAAKAVGTPGMVAQYLAGVPDLERHYAGPGADPYGQAVITAAMDMARLGHAGPYPEALLRYAVVGYLDDSLRTANQDVWWDKSLQYEARELRGTVSALAPVPPTQATGVAGYRIADYLEQLGRRDRAALLGPASLWTAFAVCATGSADLARLGHSAYDRGRYRMAATLWKRAVEAGDRHVAPSLLDLMRRIDPKGADHVAKWIADRVSLDSPDPQHGAVSSLSSAEIGDAQIGEPLMRAEARTCPPASELSRDPGGHYRLDAVLLKRVVATDQPLSVLRLYRELRDVGYCEEAAALGRRFAAESSFKDPRGLADMYTDLREAGDHEAVSLLVARAVSERALRGLASRPVEYLWAAVDLIGAFYTAGETEAALALARQVAVEPGPISPQRSSGLSDLASITRRLPYACGPDGVRAVKATLLAHPVVSAALDNPRSVANRLSYLRFAEADEAVVALLNRDPASHVTLHNPGGVAELLVALREEGATADATSLAGRAAAEVALSDTAGVAVLLDVLGLRTLAEVLARRVAEHGDTADPAGAASLLRALIRLGFRRQAIEFADRAAQQSELADTEGVRELFVAMGHEAFGDALARLAERSVDAGFFAEARRVNSALAMISRFGLELDGTASPPWAWQDL
jgi:hypothetical protein